MYSIYVQFILYVVLQFPVKTSGYQGPFLFSPTPFSVAIFYICTRVKIHLLPSALFADPQHPFLLF